jgi:hypothetical protein
MQNFLFGCGPRLRVIQTRRTPRPQSPVPTAPVNPVYEGDYFTAGEGFSYWNWNKKRQGILAAYWADILTDADRTAWDVFNPLTGNGFDAFMAWNKIAGPCCADDADADTNLDLIPYALPPRSYSPPTDPTIAEVHIDSPTAPSGERAVILYTPTTNPLLFRIYANSPQRQGRMQPTAPIIALASGIATPPLTDEVHNAGYGFTIPKPTAMSNPVTLHVTATFQQNTGLPFPVIIDIAVTGGAAHPWLTLVATAPLANVNTQEMSAFIGAGPAALTFDIVIDMSTFVPPPDTDSATIQFQLGGQPMKVTAQTITAPAGGPFNPADLFLPPGPLPLYFITRQNNPPYLIADFLGQYLRIFGDPRAGTKVSLNLRSLDDPTGSWSNKATIETIVG